MIDEEKSNEWIKNHCRDYGDYPMVIGTEIPKDFNIPNHPEYFLKDAWKKEVLIEITSYRGISIGAAHYYATIKVNQPDICSKGDNGNTLVHGGYICDEWSKIPKNITDNIGGMWTVEALRQVTEEEIKKDPQRWEGYRPDEYVSSFETKENAIKIAKKIAKLRFPNRKIEIKDYSYC